MTKKQETTPAANSAVQHLERKFQPAELGGMEAAERTGAMVLMPVNMGEAMEFAKLMAVTNSVPPHLRGKPGDCLAVIMQSMRWRMDPFAVANKSYFVNDRMAYESQLVNAVVYAHAPLEGRLVIEYKGEGEDMVCFVTGRIIDDPNPHIIEQPIKTITVRNSPLWKQAPRQQLGYFTTREWARLYTPDVLLGIYTPDEMSNNWGSDNARDVTPRPNRAKYIEAARRQEEEDKKRMAQELAGATGGRVYDEGGDDAETEQTEGAEAGEQEAGAQAEDVADEAQPAADNAPSAGTAGAGGGSGEHPYLNSFRQSCAQCWDEGNLDAFLETQVDNRAKLPSAVKKAADNIVAGNRKRIRDAGAKQGGMEV